MEKNKFNELSIAINHFAFEVADKNLTQDNFETIIDQNGLRDEGNVNTFRVICDFDDKEITITIGFYVRGQFFKIGEGQTKHFDELNDADRYELLDLSADISAKIVKYLDEHFPKFRPNEIDNDYTEQYGFISQTYADIKIKENL